MKQLALLIGINQYQFVGSVKYAEQDASSFSMALTKYCGFTENEKFLMTHGNGVTNIPTQRVIENRLRQIRDTETELDLLVIGFWGHGFIGPNSKRYLCAFDTEEDELERTGISLESLQNDLIQTGASNTLLILDCCQNYPARGNDTLWTDRDEEELHRVQSRDIVASKRRKGFHIDERQPSRFGIMNACSAGQRAYELDDRAHGVFTAHLLDALQNGIYSYTGITDYVTQHVRETSIRLNNKQTPSFRLKGVAIFCLEEDSQFRQIVIQRLLRCRFFRTRKSYGIFIQHQEKKDGNRPDRSLQTYKMGAFRESPWFGKKECRTGKQSVPFPNSEPFFLPNSSLK